ncbi:hypothetical protein SCB29_13105 [Paraburkholderia sp. SIMBA_055]
MTIGGDEATVGTRCRRPARNETVARATAGRPRVVVKFPHFASKAAVDDLLLLKLDPSYRSELLRRCGAKAHIELPLRARSLKSLLK